MKNKLIYSLVFGAFVLPKIVLAQSTEIVAPVEEKEVEKSGELRANFKRIAIEASSTSVKNGEKYENSPVSSLSADSKTVLAGVFDFAIEYEQEKYRWDNIIYTKYSREKTKAINEVSEVDKKDDEIRFETDYTRKIWKYNDADFGPFINAGYQTEWSKDDSSPKTSIARGKAGLKLFNGKHFSSLYIAGVGEHDMTYATDISKVAIEIGEVAKFPLREGVNFQVEGYYRVYVHYSDYAYEDFKYDLNLVSRMDVKLNDTLSLAPFISYRYAESRGAGVAGSNFMIGISGVYSDMFKM